MDQKFSEFSEFRESDKSLKHELGSIERSSLLPVSCWRWSLTQEVAGLNNLFKI